MRLKLTAGAGLCVLAAAIAAAGTPAAAFASQPSSSRATVPSYYVSLGDSLARGAQPNATGKTVPTSNGYANFLYATAKQKLKRLRLEELGCLGESTTTIRNGGICHYPGGSQLAAALQFIKHHKISFITIDIGANDVDGCAQDTGSQLITCVTGGLTTIKSNLPKILQALRKAAGANLTIAGMTYYDPFLGYYFGTPARKQLASESVALSTTLNGDLVSAFHAQQVKVADVASAFQTYTPFTVTATLAGHGRVPLAVKQVCTLTWMCAAAPRGPNIHANTTGYKDIAHVFAEQTIG